MRFTQTIEVRAGSADDLADLLRNWHRDQAGAAPGYERARVLADRDDDGRYVIEVEFTDAQAAQDNNDRAETGEWAERLQQVVQGQPAYRNYDVAYSTG